MHIAWTHVAAEYPDEMPRGTSRMQEADIVFDEGKPKLSPDLGDDLYFKMGNIAYKKRDRDRAR